MRHVVSVAFLGTMLVLGSCNNDEEPAGWHEECSASVTCPASLMCLPNPQAGTQFPAEVCTWTCKTDSDCPRPNNQHCHERFPCIDGVCGGNWGCR